MTMYYVLQRSQASTTTEVASTAAASTTAGDSNATTTAGDSNATTTTTAAGTTERQKNNTGASGSNTTTAQSQTTEQVATTNRRDRDRRAGSGKTDSATCDIQPRQERRLQVVASFYCDGDKISMADVTESTKIALTSSNAKLVTVADGILGGHSSNSIGTTSIYLKGPLKEYGRTNVTVSNELVHMQRLVSMTVSSIELDQTAVSSVPNKPHTLVATLKHSISYPQKPADFISLVQFTDGSFMKVTEDDGLLLTSTNKNLKPEMGDHNTVSSAGVPNPQSCSEGTCTELLRMELHDTCKHNTAVVGFGAVVSTLAEVQSLRLSSTMVQIAHQDGPASHPALGIPANATFTVHALYSDGVTQDITTNTALVSLTLSDGEADDSIVRIVRDSGYPVIVSTGSSKYGKTQVTVSVGNISAKLEVYVVQVVALKLSAVPFPWFKNADQESGTVLNIIADSDQHQKAMLYAHAHLSTGEVHDVSTAEGILYDSIPAGIVRMGSNHQVNVIGAYVSDASGTITGATDVYATFNEFEAATAITITTTRTKVTATAVYNLTLPTVVAGQQGTHVYAKCGAEMTDGSKYNGVHLFGATNPTYAGVVQFSLAKEDQDTKAVALDKITGQYPLHFLDLGFRYITRWWLESCIGPVTLVMHLYYIQAASH